MRLLRRLMRKCPSRSNGVWCDIKGPHLIHAGESNGWVTVWEQPQRSVKV